MRWTVQRLLRLGLVAVLTGSLTLWTLERRKTLREAAYAESASEAKRVLHAAHTELNLLLKEVETRAAGAASLNPVRAMVAQRVDRATLEDAFHTEDWWRPFREEFETTAISWDHKIFDLSGDGEKDSKAWAFLLEAAVGHSPSSSFFANRGKPYVGSAATVEVPVGALTSPGMILLAKPVTVAGLTNLSQHVSSAMLLAQDRRVLLAAGPQEETRRLETAIDRGCASPVLGENGLWTAACSDLGGGLSLWIHTNTEGISDRANWIGHGLMILIWGVGAAIALLVMGYGPGKPSRGPSLPPMNRSVVTWIKPRTKLTPAGVRRVRPR